MQKHVTPYVFGLIISSMIFGQLTVSQPTFAQKKIAAASTAVAADTTDADPATSADAKSSDAISDDKPEKTQKTTKTAKGEHPDEAVKHYNRGVDLHQSGFLNQAISEYKAAIEADDQFEEAWSNLGGVYASQKSFNKAIEAFEKALEIKPDRPTTLNGLGTVLYDAWQNR